MKKSMIQKELIREQEVLLVDRNQSAIMQKCLGTWLSVHCLVLTNPCRLTCVTLPLMMNMISYLHMAESNTPSTGLFHAGNTKTNGSRSIFGRFAGGSLFVISEISLVDL